MIAHLTQIGQQLGIREWRHTDIVDIQHVAGPRGIEVGRQHDAIVPEGHVHTHVERLLDLPAQVGVGITDDAQRSDRGTANAHHTIGLHQLSRHVRVDTT